MLQEPPHQSVTACKILPPPSKCLPPVDAPPFGSTRWQQSPWTVAKSLALLWQMRFHCLAHPFSKANHISLRWQFLGLFLVAPGLRNEQLVMRPYNVCPSIRRTPIPKNPLFFHPFVFQPEKCFWIFHTIFIFSRNWSNKNSIKTATKHLHAASVFHQKCLLVSDCYRRLSLGSPLKQVVVSAASANWRTKESIVCPGKTSSWAGSHYVTPVRRCSERSQKEHQLSAKH